MIFSRRSAITPVFMLVFATLVTLPTRIVADTHPFNFEIKEISTPKVIKEKLLEDWPEDGIITFPESGRKPWIQAIQSAKKEIKMAAYKLSDPRIVNELIGAREKGVKVDILIQPYTFEHDKSANTKSPIEELKSKGINIHTASPMYNQVHHKLILVDGEWGCLGTGNLDAESFDGDRAVEAAPCRDFLVTITNPDLLNSINTIFQADIERKRIAFPQSQLVWGPEDQRSIFLKMINSAKKSIIVYQQDFQDKGIAEAVAEAARQGVKVEVLMMPYPFSKKEDRNIPNQDLIRQAGGKIYLHTKHYVHAKALIIDAENESGALMYVGSCNFYPESIERNRELGILIKDHGQISKILEKFEEDKATVE